MMSVCIIFDMKSKRVFPFSGFGLVAENEGWRMVPRKTWVSENFNRISKSRKRF